MARGNLGYLGRDRVDSYDQKPLELLLQLFVCKMGIDMSVVPPDFSCEDQSV